MTAQTLVVLALLELEDQLLGALELLDNLSNNLHTSLILGVHVVTINHTQGLELDLLADLSLKLLNVQQIASSNLVLITTGFHNCVHVTSH